MARRTGKFVGPENRDAVCRRTFAGLVSSQLPPRSAAKSTITEPGAMPPTISAVTSIGDFRAGNRGRGDHHVVFGDDLSIISRCRR